MISNLQSQPPIDTSELSLRENNTIIARDEQFVIKTDDSQAMLTIDKADEVEAKDNSEVDYTKLATIVEKSLDDPSVSVDFSYDEDANQMVMKVIDNETKEIVRQLPPEMFLKIAKIVDNILETSGQITNARI